MLAGRDERRVYGLAGLLARCRAAMVRPRFRDPGDRVVDIFDEVEEDLRAERAQALLRRYGGAIVAAAVAVVCAVALYQAWQWYQARQVARIADAYLAATLQADSIPAAGDPARREAAANAFMQIAATAPDGYRTLARLRAAGLRADGGDQAAALGLWERVAADNAADPLLRDLASLLFVEHQIDGGDPAALQARLGPLIQPGNAWRPMAEEASALLDLRAGRTADARVILGRLTTDPAAPEGVRGRASALLAGIAG